MARTIKDGAVILGTWDNVAGTWYFTQQVGKPLSVQQLGFVLSQL